MSEEMLGEMLRLPEGPSREAILRLLGVSTMTGVMARFATFDAHGRETYQLAIRRIMDSDTVLPADQPSTLIAT